MIKMSKKDELNISKYLETYFDLTFKNSKYYLNKWGQVDDYVEINKNTLLFLEVETSQKHPNTNVLKLWPFLEEEKTKKIFLIQALFTNSPGLNSSRGNLGEWTGKQLENIYPNRFKYNKIIFEKDKIELKSNKLKEELNKFIDSKIKL